MIFRLSLLLFLALLIVGCDSGEDLPADTRLFAVSVETPSGDPVPGLSLMMEYALVGAGGGARPAAPADLRFFEVFLDGDVFVASWETRSEADVALFTVEAGTSEDDLAVVAEVSPQGPDLRYEVEVEGAFEVFRLGIEDAAGGVEYSDLVQYITVVEEGPAVSERPVLRTGYPNPFVTTTTFQLEMPRSASATLEVLDLEGRPAFEGEDLPPGYLAQQEFVAGSESIRWGAKRDVAAGYYQVRLIVADDTATVISVYAGPSVEPGELRVSTALGSTDEAGRFATDDRARFPQLYRGIETEYRTPDNVYLGNILPSGDIVLVLRDGAGREQRYERTLEGNAFTFDLVWNPG